MGSEMCIRDSVCIEAALPHTMADYNDGGRRADFALIFCEHASHRRLDTQRLEHGSREVLPADAFGESVFSFGA